MVSKMLVIKKVSKEDPSTAFSAGFATTGVLPTNGSKTPIAGSSVYKNLVPKPAVAPTKVSLYLFVLSDNIFTFTIYFLKKIPRACGALFLWVFCKSSLGGSVAEMFC